MSAQLGLQAFLVLCWLRMLAALITATALLVGAATPLWLLSVPFALCATWLVGPTAVATMAPASAAMWIAQGLGEVLLGSLLGLSLVAPLLSLRFAGALSDAALWTGHALREGPLARAYAWLAAALFAAFGGLRVAAEVIVDGLLARPPGSLSARLVDAPLWATLRLLADAFAWSLLFAGPVLLGSVLALLILGLVSRLFAPHGPALAAALPLRTLLVIALCMLSLSAFGPALQAHTRQSVDRARSLTAP